MIIVINAYTAELRSSNANMAKAACSESHGPMVSVSISISIPSHGLSVTTESDAQFEKVTVNTLQYRAPLA